MACKKSELVAAINSFASARVSGDPTLLSFSAKLVEQCIESLEYAAEEGQEPEPEPEPEVS